MRTSTRACQPLVVAVALLFTAGLSAATYQPGPDLELARNAPLIVRASVVSQTSRLESIGDSRRAFTLVSFAALEKIKGDVPDAFTVRLPGGKVGDVASWVPGTPKFALGGEVVLFLERAPGHVNLFRLTEFGMSRYDLVDGFAIRPAFGPRADIAVADRADLLDGVEEKAAVPARDAGSFLRALRAVAAGQAPDDIEWRKRSDRDPARSKWANIGGREPGGGCGQPCLFRWFWDSGTSPNGVATVIGTQTNLTNDDSTGCGTDSVCDVQHAIDEWHAVTGTDVRYSGPTAGGNIDVTLDALQDYQSGSAWTTALGCGPGVIGLGGPDEASGPRTYRGDTTFFASTIGHVSMRKVTCATGYSARTFKTAVMHELGHTLGLGHSDDDGGPSLHSTTPASSWDSAVMHSSVPSTKPDTPTEDDIEAITYYYTTGSLGAPPAANFTISPSSPVTGAPVGFTDTSTGGPIAWAWDFGDPGSGSSNTSTAKNPSHTYSSPGTYTVKLTAGSATGSGVTTKSVTVGAGTGGCVPSSNTLCLNSDRFAVRAHYRTNDGRSGDATGVELTADSGYLYFFNAANIEVVVKVLNACALNGHYWVFAAGLTNVEVILTVTDTQNGTVKTYTNPLGTAYAPVQDASAFATCP